MALPPVEIASRDVVRLIAPTDPAVDATSTGEEALRVYASGEDLDPRNLTLHQDQQPTWFTVGGLAPHEMRALRSVLVEVPERHDPGYVAAAVDRAVQVVRFGLRGVDGLPGWENARRKPLEHLPSYSVWTVASVEAIPVDVLLFLMTAILSLSELDPKPHSSSGSPHGHPGGTNGAKTKTVGDGARATSTTAKGMATA